MMLNRFFGNGLWVQPIVMVLALGAFAVQTVQAQSSSTWDEILVNHGRQSGRPAGGGGVGGDIIVFDIVDSVAKAAGRPAGGGGGQDIIVFDIVDSVAAIRVMLLDESAVPGVYEVLVDTGDSFEFGLMWVEEQAVKDGKPGAKIYTVRLTIML